MRKLLSTASAIGIIASSSLINTAYADVAANTLPIFKDGTNVGVTTNGNNMNIKITDPTQHAVGTANWKAFNIGKDASVNVEFSAHNQTSLNYVDAAGGMSQIYGKFTDSGCYNCGYEGTGKVILINPNGVLFGSGANVNLNSFTATTMNGTYDKNSKTLTLKRNANSNAGIFVEDGAKIYGDKNVAFASDNINIYKGSQISTNTTAVNIDNNGDGVKETALGKVKLITGDGVNFKYYNNAAIDKVDNLQTSADKMTLWIGGNIQSGQIDARNASTHVDSEVNTNGAVLRAYKAEKGSDGNIWLTANNRVITEKTELTTYNSTNNAASRAGGNIKIESNNKSTLNNDTVNAVGNVDVITHMADGKAYTDHEGIARTNDGNVNVDNTKITAKDITLDAFKTSSIQNGSVVKGNNVTVKGNERGQVVSSNVTADNDINVKSGSGLVWTASSNLNAGQDINLESTNNSALLQNTTNIAGRNINVKTYGNVLSENLTGSTFTAGNNVNVESTQNSIALNGLEQFKPTSQLNLKAAKDVQVTRDTDLTIKNVNIDAGNDISLASNNATLTLDSTTKFVNAKNIYLKGGQDVVTNGTLDLNSLKGNIQAGRDVNVTLANVGNPDKGLVAVAGKDMTVTTPGTLSVAYLKSGNDMTINANKVIKGKEYMDDPTLSTSTDTSSRSYIEVGGENFTSNVTEKNYEVTASDDRTNDGQYFQRHHIQYGDEKIYLVHKIPAPTVDDPTIGDSDDGREKGVIEPGSSIPTTVPTIDTSVPTQPTQTFDTKPTDPTPPTSPTCDSPFDTDDITDETI